VTAPAWAGPGPAGERTASGPTDGCPHSFDVLHYAITLYVDIDSEVISGSAVIRARCEEPGLDTLDLDFAVLAVDSVSSGGTLLAAAHNDPVLTIYLGQAQAVGDTFEVEVFYHGHPGNTGPDEMGGFYFGGFPKCAMQVGETIGADPPSMGKYMFPCWDRPCDKATAEFHITVPGTGRKVVCNGVLAGTVIDSVGGTATYDWVEDHPVATHRVALHAGRYTDLVDSTYDFIHYYVYPRLVEDAIINFENVHSMMDAFVEAFGPYPFPKLAYVSAANADVAHQNCITYPSGAITPDHGNDWHVADGLARQWWGACVGIGDWRDVWICESFGRYGEPLFVERAYGAEAYHDYVYNNLIVHTFNDADPCSPVYDPLHPGGHTIYEKGAVVLHMLRYVLGDSTFFASLRGFRQAYEYGVATTQDFQAAVDTVSGQSLGWFFDEWIYGCGWPEFEYAWVADEAGDAWEVYLVLNQVQDVGPVFTMPIEVGLTTAVGDTVLTVWVDEVHEEFALLVAGEPLGLCLDPNRWVLQLSTEVAYAAVDGETGPGPGFSVDVYPNPARDGVTIRYRLPAHGRAHVRVYDAAGRMVADVYDGILAAGVGELRWDGNTPSGERAAPGAYFCRVQAAGGSRTAGMVLLR
jgi:aminopeptidase N